MAKYEVSQSLGLEKPDSTGHLTPCFAMLSVDSFMKGLEKEYDRDPHGKNPEGMRAKMKTLYKSDRERISYISGHLSSPIVEADPIFLLEVSEDTVRRCRRHKVLRDKVYGQFKGCKLIGNVYKDPIGRLQSWVRSTKIDPVDRDFQVCLDSMDNLIVQKMCFMRPFIASFSDEQNLLDYLHQSVAKAKREVSELRELYTHMRRAEAIKDAICFKEMKDGELLPYQGLWAEQDVCFLEDGKEPLLFSTNLLLCALDKVQSQFGLEAYWKISDALGKYPGHSVYKRGKELLDIFEFLRSKMGQDFFTLVSGFESLTVGWVVGAEDDAGCKDLFRTEYTSSQELLAKYNLESYLVKILPPNRIFYSVLIALEMTGIVKSFGYPTLIAERMLDQIFEYGTVTRFDIDHSLLNKVEGVMRREMCINYYKKHTKYPKIASCPPSLKRLLQNRPLLEKTYKLYDDWASVVFGKTFEFDYVPDQADMIKDSAAAVNRSAWHKSYDPCAFRHKYGKGPPTQGKQIYCTRTIEAFLQADEGEIKRLIDRQDQGYFDHEDWICIECQKECELKGVSGRAFTKQTPPRRLIQVTAEHNIATQIFPYVPEQSMTDPEIKNCRRILQQVSSLQRTSLFFSLDLKKWCLNWRHEVVEMTGRMYDELFGMRTFFRNSHLFFVGCLVLSNNRLTPPDYDSCGEPIAGELCCKNFIGAMEGLCQKFWTHPTGALIRYVMETSNVSGDIMGQGDNQVIVLHFSKDDTRVTEKREAFLKNLSAGFQGMNHELKRKETWWSTKLHEYSKQRVFKGICVSYGTKKAAKLIPDINDGLFSFSSSMSTINTITEGIARADNNPDAAFMLNQFYQTSYMLRKKIFHSGMDRKKMRGALFWPIEFGGIPNSSYTEHAVRGNDDKVAQWLGVYLEARHLKSDMARQMENMWVIRPETKARNAQERSRLYEDIYCLRVPVPPSCEASMKDMIERALRDPDFVKNPGIRKLYNTDVSMPYEKLIEAVDLMRPNYLPASHELLAASNVGRLMQLRGKLTSSKTLQKVVQLTEKVSWMAMITDKNSLFSRYTVNGMDKTCKVRAEFFDQLVCPSEGARLLRDWSWGINLVDITKAPTSHQVVVRPLDLCSREDLYKGITVRISGEMEQAPRQCYLTYGPARNYVGSKTKVKTKKSVINIIEKSGFVKNLKKIGLIRSWFTLLGDENMVRFCTALMEEKRSFIAELPDDLNDLGELCDTVTSGNILHRFQSSVEHNSALLNCLPSISGHFEYSSNSMMDLTAGGKDLTVFYQYIMVAVTTGLAMYTNITGVASGGYMILFPCDTCTQVIPDIRIRMPGYVPTLYHKEISVTPIIHRLQVDYSYPEVRCMMSGSVGLSLALNVEENFRVHHSQGQTSLTSMDYKRDVVSLNDLRLLDLRLVLGVALAASRHGNRLYFMTDEVLTARSDDRSFLYMSECLIESGLAPKVFGLIGVRPSEHAEITTSYGMSRYLSRTAKIYLEREGEYIVQEGCKYLYQDSSTYQVDNVLEFANNWMRRHNKISHKSYKRALGELRTTKNFGIIGKQLKITFKTLPFTTKDTITLWRNTCKDQEVDLAYTPIEYSYPVPRTTNYPRLEVCAYHGSRTILAHPRDSVSIPQLSFHARPIGVISSAVNKFVEVLLMAGILDWFHDLGEFYYIALAEGSGGTLACLLSLFPQCTGLYNTWLRTDIANKERVNDREAPAVVALQLSPSRVVRDSPLIVGETDITHPTFLGKLTKCVTEYNPRLVTMDAESEEGSRKGGSNLRYLQTAISAIMKTTSACVIIVKMFLQASTMDQIKQVMAESNRELEYTLTKPISSNPVGREVYLLITPKGLISEQKEFLADHQENILSYVEKGQGMSKSQIEGYIQVAHQVAGSITSIFCPSLTIKNVYSAYMPEIGCSLLCPRFFDKMMNAVDRTHTNEEDVDVFLSIRAKATNGALRELSHDLVFLMVYHCAPSRISLVDRLRALSQIKIAQDIGAVRLKIHHARLVLSSASGELGLWAGWEDGRMYMGDSHHRLVHCGCPLPYRYLSWTQEGRVGYNSLYSYHLFQGLAFRSLVADGMYESMRRELHRPTAKPRHTGPTMLEDELRGEQMEDE